MLTAECVDAHTAEHEERHAARSLGLSLGDRPDTTERTGGICERLGILDCLIGPQDLPHFGWGDRDSIGGQCGVLGLWLVGGCSVCRDDRAREQRHQRGGDAEPERGRAHGAGGRGEERAN